MGKQEVVVYLKCFVICTLCTLASSVTVGQSTSRPRHTRFQSSTPSPESNPLVTPSNDPVAPEGTSLYRASASNGATCILLRTDGIIEVKYKLHFDDEQIDTYLPNSPLIEASCRYEDTSSMTLSWKGYTLTWAFAKTPGGERWYIDKLELTVSTSLLEGFTSHEKTFKLVHNQMLFPTPVGKSYSCKESVVQLVPKEEDNLPAGLRGILYLRFFKLQPFMYKGSDFGPPFECNAQLGFRDETAPIAVGSTLAIAVLMTVTGYGIFRYFKIKKVQYNTME